MSYTIQGGQEGKARLSILGQAMNRYSIEALQGAGLKQGSKCLDAGCGGGTMTYAMAEIAGPGGYVTGMDRDAEIIRLNMQELDATHIGGISFVQGEIYNLDGHEEYDIVYARFLLSHLTDPVLAITKMVRALKPGGQLVTEDVHFSGHFCYPANDAFDTYVRWYTDAVSANGGDAEFGVKLHAYLETAGLADIQMEIVQPAALNGPAKQMSLITLEKIRNSVLANNITSEEEFERIINELKAFTENSESMISMPRIFQVWGRKAA